MENDVIADGMYSTPVAVRAPFSLRGNELPASGPALKQLSPALLIADEPVDEEEEMAVDRAVCAAMAGSLVDRVLSDCITLNFPSFDLTTSRPGSQAPTPVTSPRVAAVRSISSTIVMDALPPIASSSIVQRYESLKESHERLSAELKAAQDAEAHAASLVDAITLSKEEALAELAQENAAAQAHLESRVASAEKERQLLAEQLSELKLQQSQAASSRDASAEYQARYESVLADNSLLRKRASEAFTLLMKQSAEHDILLSSVRAASVDQRGAIEKLSGKLLETEAALACKVTECDTLSTQLAQSVPRTEANALLNGQVAQMQLDHANALVALSQTLQSSETRAAQAEQTVEKLGAELEALRRLLTTTQADLALKDNERSFLSEQLKESESQLETWRKKAVSAEQQVLDALLANKSQSTESATKIAQLEQRLQEVSLSLEARDEAYSVLRTRHARDAERLAELQAAEDETKTGQLTYKMQRVELESLRESVRRKDAEITELRTALATAMKHMEAAPVSVAGPDEITIPVSEYESLNDAVQQADRERALMMEYKAKAAAKIETLQHNLSKSELEASKLDQLLDHVETVMRTHAGLFEVHPDLKQLLWEIGTPSDQ